MRFRGRARLCYYGERRASAEADGQLCRVSRDGSTQDTASLCELLLSNCRFKYSSPSAACEEVPIRSSWYFQTSEISDVWMNLMIEKTHQQPEIGHGGEAACLCLRDRYRMAETRRGGAKSVEPDR